MSRWKRIAITAAALLSLLTALPFGVALFIGQSFTVERAVTIEQPRDAVFDYLRHLRNHVQFSYWARLDPQMRTTYRGEDGTVGFVAAWDSDSPDVGKSEQELKAIRPGARVDIEIRFREPFRSTDPAWLTTEALDAGRTRVTFGYRGRMPYPLNLMCFLVAGRIGDAMEKSLATLKSILEPAR